MYNVTGYRWSHWDKSRENANVAICGCTGCRKLSQCSAETMRRTDAAGSHCSVHDIWGERRASGKATAAGVRVARSEERATYAALVAKSKTRGAVRRDPGDSTICATHAKCNDDGAPAVIANYYYRHNKPCHQERPTFNRERRSWWKYRSPLALAISTG
mmetsp:Transcript_37870/g.67862  ORF Transcript_37870/g.67862 Transcript_37870/m.67862 type:complete len:159 (+) Transcript_37870:989-1465(+)